MHNEPSEYVYDEPSSPRRRFVVIAVAVVVLAVVSVGIISSSMKTVPTGTKGVLLTWGKVVGTVDEGLNWIIPVAQDIVLMDVTVRKAETPEATGTLDLQAVTTTIAVNYRLDERHVEDIWRKFRKEYETRVIQPSIEESIKATTAKFRAEELITRRTEIREEFKRILGDKLDEYHIILIEANIVDFQFSAEFNRAIEAKVTAEQQALEAKNILVRIEYEAQQKVIQAEAEANATVTRATAEAKAIEIINEQLYKSPLYLQYIAIDKWDGKLPYFMGTEAVPFISIQPPEQAP